MCSSMQVGSNAHARAGTKNVRCRMIACVLGTAVYWMIPSVFFTKLLAGLFNCLLFGSENIFTVKLFILFTDTGWSYLCDENIQNSIRLIQMKDATLVPPRHFAVVCISAFQK